MWLPECRTLLAAPGAGPSLQFGVRACPARAEPKLQSRAVAIPTFIQQFGERHLVLLALTGAWRSVLGSVDAAFLERTVPGAESQRDW